MLTLIAKLAFALLKILAQTPVCVRDDADTFCPEKLGQLVKRLPVYIDLQLRQNFENSDPLLRVSGIQKLASGEIRATCL